MKDNRLYLSNIKECIEQIESYTVDGKEAFLQNRMIQDAVIRNCEIIGEATNRILKVDKNFLLKNARKIVDTRNWVIHAHDSVDDIIIWSIVNNHLPKLKIEVDKLLKNKCLKIKICGMKYSENIQEVASLQPDYLGFIFYPKSPRNFEGEIPKISNQIKKAGVFVDAEIDFVLEKVEKYNFKAVQLHGNESVEYCRELKTRLYNFCQTERSRSQKNKPHRFQKPVRFEDNINNQEAENNRNIENDDFRQAKRSRSPEGVEVFKVFGVKDTFDFSVLKSYEEVVDYFLFDTKGKEKGGNGYTFDWSVLKEYNSKTQIILSGGIGIDELNKIEQILKTDLPIYALDLNSKFETEPGKKDIKMLKEFLGKVKVFSPQS